MSQQAFSLIICIPGEEPARHDLTPETVSIGRSPENGIQILVAEVSVRHGSVGRAGEFFVLADTGSTNGTTVNGVPVGADGVALSPMDKIVFGTLVAAYVIPSVILDSTPVHELIASIEAAPKAVQAVAQPKTAPVATAVRAAVALPGASSPGSSTVKLDQVRAPAPAPGGVRPAAVPIAPRQPLPGAPGAPAGGPPRAPGAPAAPAPPRAPGVPGAPPAPRAPGVAPLAPPRPAGVQPAKLPTAPPAGAPATIPLKRVAPGAPTIPLPKLPPKPGV
jgi:predicted component of type VI protein secretion system